MAEEEKEFNWKRTPTNTMLIYKATCRRGTVASVANLQREILLIKNKLNRVNEAIESRCQKYESLNNWSIIATF